MSPDEARAALLSRAPRYRTPEWLHYEVAYEERPGIHTYSRCDCGRRNTRAGYCVLCLREMLAVAEAEGRS